MQRQIHDNSEPERVIDDIGDFVETGSPTMRALEAAATLPIFGVPVLREGNVINLPTMSLEVAQACSGIRSLFSLITLATIYGYLIKSTLWTRVVLVLAAFPIAIVANSFRIIGTGLLVQYWDPAKAVGFFHEFSGELLFLISLLMLVLLQQALSPRRSEVRTSGGL